MSVARRVIYAFAKKDRKSFPGPWGAALRVVLTFVYSRPEALRVKVGRMAVIFLLLWTRE